MVLKIPKVAGWILPARWAPGSLFLPILVAPLILQVNGMLRGTPPTKNTSKQNLKIKNSQSINKLRVPCNFGGCCLFVCFFFVSSSFWIGKNVTSSLAQFAQSDPGDSVAEEHPSPPKWMEMISAWDASFPGECRRMSRRVGFLGSMVSKLVKLVGSPSYKWGYIGVLTHLLTFC